MFRFCLILLSIYLSFDSKTLIADGGHPTINPAMKAADIILLGEIHDNHAHHIYQANIITALADEKTAILFEMLPVDLQAKIDGFNGTPDQFGAFIAWDKMGWPDYQHYYQQIFIAIKEKNAKIIAAGTSSKIIRNIYQKGYEALPQTIYEVFNRLIHDFNDEDPALLEEQYIAHCEAIPKAKLPAMVRVQRARDLIMAYYGIKALQQGFDNIIYITGRGHVRKDRAIPFFLQHALPDATQFVVGLGEDQAIDHLNLELYDESIVLDAPLHRPDPCAIFKTS